jgi:two-component system cell cycle response regulator CtrA
MRVLLVRRHSYDATSTKAILKSTGFVVDDVVDQDAAFGFLRQYDYEIIVLDRAMRDSDACAFIQSMRGRGIEAPVLLLTTAPAVEITVRALRAGADDVMTGAFRDDEFVARIEAIVRRSNGHGKSTLQVGPMVIDINSHDVIINGQALHLTKKEFSILQLLALRRGKVLTKPQILDDLYDGMDDPEIGIVGVYICNLRKKLAAHGAGRLIDTVRGCGYVMRDYPTILPIAAAHSMGMLAARHQAALA